MSNKIAKVLARQKERIEEGNYYEAHQQLRVITSRYLKSSDYDSAASVLSNGALLLLKAGQGGSGGDLASMLVNEVYTKGEWECNQVNKDRLIEILNAFPKNEPTRKRFIQEMLAWSGKYGEVERGDPELQHAAGKVYADDGDVYDAERHLLLGLPESAAMLAQVHYTWYKEDSPHLAPTYASRSVLPYLVLGNLASATSALSHFTSQLTSLNPALSTQPLDSAKSSIRIFPSLPLLNFLALLVLAAQKGDSSLFRQLTKQYAAHMKESVGDLWSEALANIGEIWFGIKIPKGGNPLMDMMGSMLFGGGQKTPRSSTPKPKAVAGDSSKPAAPATAPPPSMDLD